MIWFFFCFLCLPVPLQSSMPFILHDQSQSTRVDLLSFFLAGFLPCSMSSHCFHFFLLPQVLKDDEYNQIHRRTIIFKLRAYIFVGLAKIAHGRSFCLARLRYGSFSSRVQNSDNGTCGPMTQQHTSAKTAILPFFFFFLFCPWLICVPEVPLQPSLLSAKAFWEHKDKSPEIDCGEWEMLIVQRSSHHELVPGNSSKAKGRYGGGIGIFLRSLLALIR